MKKIFKNSCLIMLITFCIMLVSCDANLEKPYNMDNVNIFLYEDNDIRKAESFSKNLFIPNALTEEKANGVTVDSFLLASEKGDISPIHRYKNPYTKRYIASLTKIITFLTVINNCTDLEKQVVVSDNAVNVGVHSSVAGLKAGDVISIKDLLYGLMLPSGNDCAVALAEAVGNSVSDFVLLMNRYAEKLGCTHSHFTNPHGLDDEYNYSTAFDMYLFLRQAYKNELFREIIGTKEKTLFLKNKNNDSEREVTLLQTNKLVTGEVTAKENITIIGGKTGSTDKAGKCLTIIAKNNINNEVFYAVVLYSTNDNTVYRNMKNLLACIE